MRLQTAQIDDQASLDMESRPNKLLKASWIDSLAVLLLLRPVPEAAAGAGLGMACFALPWARRQCISGESVTASIQIPTRRTVLWCLVLVVPAARNKAPKIAPSLTD